MPIATPNPLSHKAASTVFLVLAAALFMSTITRGHAQDLPDETNLSRLVWQSMITLDNANRSGNYDVLYASGAPEFRNSQSPESLSQLFSGLRENRIDLSRTVTISPTWYVPPQIDGNGYLRLRGGFEFRPRAIRFDILYRLVGGQWRMLGLSVVEMDASAPR